MDSALKSFLSSHLPMLFSPKKEKPPGKDPWKTGSGQRQGGGVATWQPQERADGVGMGALPSWRGHLPFKTGAEVLSPSVQFLPIRTII